MELVPYEGEVLPLYELPRANQVSSDLQDRLAGLAHDFYQTTGEPLRITDSFRTHEEQVDLKRRKPFLAATPGKSRHEFGEALDIDQSQIQQFGQENWTNLLQNHGFVRPAMSKGEYWHIELPRYEKAGKVAAATGMVPYEGEVLPLETQQPQMVPYEGEVLPLEKQGPSPEPIPTAQLFAPGMPPQLPIEKKYWQAYSQRQVPQEPGVEEPVWGNPVFMAAGAAAPGLTAARAAAQAGAPILRTGLSALGRAIPGMIVPEMAGGAASEQLQNLPAYARIPAEIAAATAGGLTTSRLGQIGKAIPTTIKGPQPVSVPTEVLEAELKPLVISGMDYNSAMNTVAAKYGHTVESMVPGIPKEPILPTNIVKPPVAEPPISSSGEQGVAYPETSIPTKEVDLLGRKIRKHYGLNRKVTEQEVTDEIGNLLRVKDRGTLDNSQERLAATLDIEKYRKTTPTPTPTPAEIVQPGAAGEATKNFLLDESGGMQPEAMAAAGKAIGGRFLEAGREQLNAYQRLKLALQRGFASDTLSPEAKATHMTIVGNAAERDVENKRMGQLLGQYRDYVGPITGERSIEFTRAFQSGADEAITDPVLREMGKAYRTEEQRQMATMKELGKSPQELDNYLDQLWLKTPQLDSLKEALISGRGRGIQGPKYFFNKRLIPDIPTGLELGLTPRYNNLVDMMLAGRSARERFIEGQKNLNWLKDSGLIKTVRSFKEIPDGWVELPDPYGKVYSRESRPGGFMVPEAAQEATMPLGGGPERAAYQEVPKFQGSVLRGIRVVPEDVATQFENYLGRVKPDIQAVTDMVNKPIHTIRLSQVALSAAHLSIEGFNSMVFGTMKGFNDLLGGVLGGNLSRAASGLKELAIKPIPFADLVKDITRGRQLTKGAITPQFATPETQAAAGLLKEGGTRFEKNYKFWSGIMAEHLKDTLQSIKEVSPIKALIGSQGRAGLLQMLSAPIMDFAVPFAKLGANERLFLKEVNRAKATLGRELFNSEYKEIAYEAQKFADNMFGKMVADNIGMNRTMKGLLSSVIQFPTWNIGSARWQAGNIRGAYQLGKNFLTNAAKPLDTQARLSLEYTGGLLMSVGLMGAMTNYAMTGEWPKTLMDYYYPRTGELKDNGEPERIGFLTYLKDAVGMYRHPGRTIWAKASAPLHILADLVSNKDYWGTRIYDPEGTYGENIIDALKYTGKSSMPFSIQGWQNTQGKSPAMAGFNYLGARPVPREYTQSPAMNVMDKYYTQDQHTKTPEQAELAKERRDIIKLYRKGDLAEADAKAWELVNAKKIPIEKADKWYDISQMKPQESSFKGLPIEWAIKTWNKATPEERVMFEPLLRDKVENISDFEFDKWKPELKKIFPAEIQ